MTNNEIAPNARRNRALLWAALAVFALGNMGSSLAGLTAVSIVLGFLTLMAGAALIFGRRR